VIDTQLQHSCHHLYTTVQNCHCLWCGESPPTGPTCRHDADAESNLSYWPWFCSCTTPRILNFNMLFN